MTPAQLALVAYAAEQMYGTTGVQQPPLAHELALDWEIVGYLTAKNALAGAQNIGLGYRVYYGFVVRAKSDPNHFLVAVRGTESAVEWLIDGEHLLIPRKGFLNTSQGMVEQGFWSIYRSMDYEHAGANVGVYAATGIAGAIPDGATVDVVGHSLGSALATYLLLDLRERDVDAHGTFFASPKPGDRAFGRYFDSLVGSDNYRVFNYTEDEVPSLPFGFFGFGFTQLPSVVKIRPHDAFATIKDDLASNHSAVSYAAMLDKSIPLPTNSYVLGRST